MSVPRTCLVSLAVVTASALVLTACGSDSDPATGSAPATRSADLPAIPSGFEDTPAVMSVVDSYAPIGFTGTDGKPAGLDPELGAVLGQKMEIDLTVKPDAFENSMLGLQAKRVQMVPGASITNERMKTMDMVPYFTDAYTLAVLPDSADVATDMSGLCGMNIGLVTGDVNIPTLEAFSKSDCVGQGKPALKISTYPDGAQIATAVKSKRVDAWACALTACSYQNAQSPGTWKITGPKFGETTIGIASLKDSGWAPLLAAGLKKAIADGSYVKVLEKYGIEGGAVTADQVVVNPDVDQ